jgi:hypothetical protein
MACAPALAAELNLTVTSGGQAVIAADPGAVVNYEVTGLLSDTANQGLSHLIFDLALEPGGAVPPATQPAAFLSFTSVNPDGYGGTVVGDVLRQVGGAQNTLGVLSGSVITGIGHTSTILATGMVAAPLADGVYTLTASNILGRVIKLGEDGGSGIWATEWAFPVSGADPMLTIIVGNGCLDLAGCADQNNDGVRDDACMWWSCDAGVCNGIDIPFADMGGQFGSCAPDLTADGNDRFHSLNCFSDQNTLGAPGYDCETDPPAAFNVDAGGPFGDCNPDGVCDGNDAFHALNAFQGTTLCSCPGPDYEPQVVGRAPLVLRSNRIVVRPGELVEVDVFLGEALADLRGYQLHLGARSDEGTDDDLELIDIAIEERKDWVFTGREAWKAFNRMSGQMVAGLDAAGVAAPVGTYLATFTYRVSTDAAGDVRVEIQRPGDGGRTFLFSTLSNAKIEVLSESPVRLAVHPFSARDRSREENRP